MTAPVDYTIFYRSNLPVDAPWVDEQWDVFISAFNSSDRVTRLFELAPAHEKHWLLHPEYGYNADEHPANGLVFAPAQAREDEFIREYLDHSGADLSRVSICVDITGFMRAPLMFLVRMFRDLGVKRFDALYSEPRQYGEQENTRFSDGVVTEVRQVAGFEGNHATDISNDVLIIGAGYDHELIAHVAEHKDNAKKLQVLGLPSLRADMYQESILRAKRAANAVGGDEGITRDHFAPAHNPFVTAQVLHDLVSDLEARRHVTNLYLSPLATKPQALGFALYYLTEWCDRECSILFPFCRTYSRETSHGVSRAWKYVVELPPQNP